MTTPKPLAVLPQGAKSADPYRLTPQELYELGKRLAAKKDYVAAMPHLTELVEKWNLRPEVYKDAVQMLLDIHLEIGPPAKIVHYFEIIKEKWPNEEIPFAKIVKVGAAYHEMGEYERSYLVFRATVESNFSRESGVAGFLQVAGRVAAERRGDERPAAEVSAGGLRGRGHLRPGPAGLCQGPRGGRRREAAAAEGQPRGPAPPRVDDAGRLPDGLSRRPGRRPGRLRLGQHAAWT